LKKLTFDIQIRIQVNLLSPKQNSFIKFETFKASGLQSQLILKYKETEKSSKENSSLSFLRYF
jgi:hypothetical protein